MWQYMIKFLLPTKDAATFNNFDFDPLLISLKFSMLVGRDGSMW